MRNHRQRPSALIASMVIGSSLLVVLALNTVSARAQEQTRNLTPIQVAIEEQRQRLNSAEIEDRREALMRLRALQRPEASRMALSALNDPAPIIRVSAVSAVLWLPPDESAAGLIPLLSDKDEFVRQQTAYALGQTHSHAAVARLIELLSDKKDSVRGAAAVALGQIADVTAVTSLAAVLSPQAGLTTSKKNKKTKPEQNPFVLRSAARSLGQIKNPAALPALITVLQDEKAESDLRREAASALGEIGDASALHALRDATTAADPYLAETAYRAVKKISHSQTARGS